MSRLEDIQKKRYFFHDIKDGELKEDWEWLIEQAELRQEQIEKNQKALECLDVIERRYNALEKQNQRLRQALEFYGDKKNYETHITDERFEPFKPIHDDNGEKARKALEREG